MKQDLWESVVAINKALQSLRQNAAQAGINMADLIDVRGKVRAELEVLRATVCEQYSEREAYFVLFPLMAHCDEVVQMLILDANKLEWPPLQWELYQVADAGDVFFELLDNALNKPETLPIIYQVYYFCLKDGFSGRYSGNPDQIADYLSKLVKHIDLAPLPTTAMAERAPAKRAYFRVPNHFYYTIAGTLLVLFYLFLCTLADNWQPS